MGELILFGLGILSCYAVVALCMAYKVDGKFKELEIVKETIRSELSKLRMEVELAKQQVDLKLKELLKKE